VSDSPLAEVVRDRRINQILEAIRAAVRLHQPISIEPKDVDYIRRSFYKGIMLGERKLYELVEMLLSQLAPKSTIDIALIVWGRCTEKSHSDVIKDRVALVGKGDEIYRISDYSMSRLHAPTCPICRTKTRTIASFLQYSPSPEPPSGVVMLIGRIKSTSNICYKIADMVFDIDFMFQRDKIYNEYSQIVTDIYGIKSILRTAEHIPSFLAILKGLPGVELIEEKDYTGVHRKKSGFEAYKVVVKIDKQLFEIQMQSLEMYDTENHSWSASHRTYKEHQLADRKKLGKEYVQLYQALTLLFAEPDQNYCDISYIELGFSKKGMDDEF
jgi:ppGpp synthetase/RelA/SpoT-type nucleotidyltranferase